MVIDRFRIGLVGKVHLRVGLLCMVLVLSLISSQTAHGHASLLSSTPADGDQLGSAPADVVLEFSEPVGLVDGGTTLHSQSDSPIVLSPTSSGNLVTIPLGDHVGEGAYIVQWRVISADSHPISGTVSFTVGDAAIAGDVAIESDLPGWVELAQTASVAVKYFGLLASLGVLLVGWSLLRGDLAIVNRVALRLAAVGLAGVVLELPFAAMIQSGQVATSFADMRSAISALDSNTLVAGVIGAFFVGWALLTVWLPANSTNHWRIATMLLIASVLTLVLSGHTRTREPMWLMMLSDAIHVVVGAVWLGGIILLTLGLRGLWHGEGFSTADQSAAVVSRFSTLAGYTALLVIVSGLAMAITILDSLDALWNTTYGVTLLIKVGLVGIVAALAAVNRFRLIPRIQADANNALSRLRRIVSLELVILVVVVGVTGSLVHENPNVVADPPPTQSSTTTTLYEGEEALDSNHTVRLKIESQSASTVTVTATIIDEDRNIVLPDADLQLSWYMPANDLGPLTQEIPIDRSTGAYQGTITLPASGDWELGLQVRIDRFTDSRTTVEVVLPD